MNQEEVIEQITRDVLSHIKGVTRTPIKGADVAQQTEKRIPPGNVLIVILSGNLDISRIKVHINNIMEREKVTGVVLSDWASMSYGKWKILNAGMGMEIVEEREIRGNNAVRSLLSNVNTIYILDMDVSSASRIAGLTPVFPAERIVVEGILMGKSVICSDTIISTVPEGTIPVCAKESIAVITKKLASMGILGGGSNWNAGNEVPFKENNSGCPADVEECVGCGKCVNLKPSAVDNIVMAGAGRISATSGINSPEPGMAKMIDHTILSADATAEKVKKLCSEAREFNFATVCVNPTHVALAASELEGSNVGITTVIGFPLGATTPTAKSLETRDAIANGATEIDMVINVGALKAGNDDLVKKDISGVVNASGPRAKVKVILETALLTDEEKIRGCLLAKMSGADYVKTSTGFGPGGATANDIRLMRKTVGPDMGVKASGGIRSFEDARTMVEAGATRIGASASVAIVKGK